MCDYAQYLLEDLASSTMGDGVALACWVVAALEDGSSN